MAKELTTQDEDFGIDVSDIMMIVMMIMMASLMSSVVASGAQGLQAQAYEGRTDTRKLMVTPVMQWENLITRPPYTPWVTAYFFNDGPGTVYVGINDPDDLNELASGEDYSVDMTGATRRIEFIFYKGSKASVRVTGKY